MRIFKHLWGPALLGLALFSLSCGGTTTNDAGSGPAQAPQTAPAGQTGLLPALPSPAELLRSASTSDSQRLATGTMFDSTLLLQLISPAGLSQADFSPACDPAAPGSPADIACAIYRFGGLDSYSGGAKLFSNWENVNLANLWLGLANFQRGSWDWYNSPVDPEINMPSMAPYIAPDGRAFVVVLLLGTETARLNWLVLGDPLLPLPELTSDLPSDPLQRLAPLQVVFDASSSQSWGSHITQYEMDYEGDGVYDDSDSSPFFLKEYNSGLFTPTLRVTDNYGQSATTSMQLHVLNPNNQAPSALFTPVMTTNTAPLPVNFDASGSMDADGTIVSYAWDFDNDGQNDYISDQPLASHTFCIEGNNTVRLRVTDSDLATDDYFGQVVCTTGWRHSTVAPLGSFLKDQVGLTVQGSGAAARPCVSYVDNTLPVLRFVRGSDNTGQNWDNPVTVDSGNDDLLINGASSLQIESLTQTPILAYGLQGKQGGPDALCFIRAANASGSNWNTPVTVSSGVGAGYDCALLQSGGKLLLAEAVYEGNPGISLLRVHRSVDSLGASWELNKQVQPPQADIGVYGAALISVPGLNPLLVWAQRLSTSGSGDSSSVWSCSATTANGADWTAPFALPQGAMLSEYSVDAGVCGGRPYLVAGGPGQGSRLFFNRANDFQGSDWTSQPQQLDDANWLGQSVSTALVDGFPAIAYTCQTDSSMRYIRALDANGATWDAPQIVDSAGQVGAHCAMTVLPGNIPLIVYQDLQNSIVKAAVFY